MGVAGDIDELARSGLQAERLRLRAFRAARRHSAFVRTARVLLPLAAIGLVIVQGVLVTSGLGLKIGAGELKVGKIAVTSEDLKMKGVSYAGVAKDGGRYDVRAKEAAVDFAQTGPVKLDFIDGDLTQPNGVVTKVVSRRGLMDNKKGEMELSDGVQIDSTNGLKARMKSAKVFNKENRVVAHEGVVAEMPTGRISADRMDMETKVRKGTFEGNVAVRLVQDANAPRASVGMGKDARAPVDVNAPRLDVDDSTRVAHFTGGVSAQQGDSSLTSKTLKVLYEGRVTVPGQAPLPKAAVPADLTASGATRVSRLQADGGVVLVAGADRRVSADSVDFDVANDKALFLGQAVEVQQGKNRLVGRRLSVDRKAGRSSLDAPADGRTPAGRIQTTFFPNEGKGTTPKAKAQPSSEGGGFMTFRTDPNAPMDVQADTLDVNDPAKQAIYRGTVRAQQADFVIQTAELIAHYTGSMGLTADADPAATKDPASKDGGAQITRVEAKSRVVITSSDGQEAVGESAVFDVKANKAVLQGPVFLKQGTNKVNGTRLHIDMTTGEARLENDAGRPQLAPALGPMVQPKSAPGPGGLPPVLQATPAPVNPAAGGACPPGRQCLEVIPEKAKEMLQQRKAQDGAGGAAKPKAEVPRSKADGWQPTTSPSPVYRAQ